MGFWKIANKVDIFGGVEKPMLKVAKKYIFPLIICLSFFICVWRVEAQESNSIFFRANNAYSEERYDDAIKDYEELVNSGVKGANIYYNLGNAYLRMGNKGKAILYYERAFRMCPRDADIQANLNFARSLVESGVQQKDISWYKQALFFLHGFLSANEITILVSALYFIIIILVALGIYFRALRRMLFYSAAAFFIILIIVLPSLIGSIYKSEYQNYAVIMVEETATRFEPNDDATVHFTLYEGAIIQVSKSQGEWHQIIRSDGKMGWLKGLTFGII